MATRCFLPALLALGFQTTCAIPQPARAADAPETLRWEKPMLWRVERQGFPVSHLFATIHLPDPLFAKFPAETESALREADVVVTEIAMDIASMVAQGERFLLPEGGVIDEILPATLMASLAEELRAISPQLDMVPFQRYKPWALLLTIPLLEAQLKHPGAVPMDLAIYQRGLVGGKKVGGLETIDEQLGLFDQFTPEEQVRMLELQVDYMRGCRRRGVAWVEEMKKAYVGRDMRAMEKASEEYLEGGGEIRVTDADRALHARLMAALLDGRNARMTERIDAMLRREKLRHFIAAGALHFSGETGIPEALARKGWRVTLLPAR